MTRTSLPTLAAVAVLGLAPLTAQAKTLVLGNNSNVTINAAGTVGTRNGSPIANTTTTYTDSGTSSIEAVETTGTAILNLGTGATLTDVNDGAGLYDDGTGTVTISGGTLTSNGAGQYTAAALYADNTGAINISGGTFTADSTGLSAGGVALFLQGTNTVTISGGTFNSPSADGAGLLDLSDGPITITGGTFNAGTAGGGDAVYASANDSITIAGGTFTASGTSPDGYDAFDLFADADSYYDLFGTNFSYTLDGQSGSTPIATGSLPTDTTNGVTGTLSGTWLDGQTFSDLTFANLGEIDINNGTPPTLPVAAPEPSQFAALSLGLLGLGALVLRTRRRAVA